MLLASHDEIGKYNSKSNKNNNNDNNNNNNNNNTKPASASASPTSLDISSSYSAILFVHLSFSPPREVTKVVAIRCFVRKPSIAS